MTMRILVFLIAVLILSFYLPAPIGNINAEDEPVEVIEPYYPATYFDHEEISYFVKTGFVKIGTAVLTFKGRINLGGKDVNHVIFAVDTLNVKDAENIFADFSSYLPLRIERNLDIWGKKINIIEEYNQDKFSVNVYRIFKKEDKRILEAAIKKNAPLQNVLMMVYKYRLKQNFKVGDKLNLSFPTKDVLATVSRIEKIKVPTGEFNAYVIETTPKQFTLWLSTDSRRLPLRIDGAVGFSSAYMVMSSVKFKEN